jgi:hypothetical protein
MKKIIVSAACCAVMATLVANVGADLTDRGYVRDANGKLRYDPSASYNKKFARSSYGEDGALVRGTHGYSSYDVRSTAGARELHGKTYTTEEEDFFNIVNSNPQASKLNEEIARRIRKTDGRYVDGYRTIDRNIVFNYRDFSQGGGSFSELHPVAQKLLIEAHKTFLTDNDFKDVGLYGDIMQKDMRSSRRVNPVEYIGAFLGDVESLIREGQITDRAITSGIRKLRSEFDSQKRKFPTSSASPTSHRSATSSRRSTTIPTSASPAIRRSSSSSYRARTAATPA